MNKTFIEIYERFPWDKILYIYSTVKDRGDVFGYERYTYAKEYQNILVCKLGGSRLQYKINMS